MSSQIVSKVQVRGPVSKEQLYQKLFSQMYEAVKSVWTVKASKENGVETYTAIVEVIPNPTFKTNKTSSNLSNTVNAYDEMVKAKLAAQDKMPHKPERIKPELAEFERKLKQSTININPNGNNWTGNF